jgi:hypothetical protein
VKATPSIFIRKPLAATAPRAATRSPPVVDVTGISVTAQANKAYIDLWALSSFAMVCGPFWRVIAQSIIGSISTLAPRSML